MTIQEIIELLQSNPTLAEAVLRGMPLKIKAALCQHYGIFSNQPMSTRIIAFNMNVTEVQIYHNIARAKLWLRHPQRMAIIRAHLKKEKRSKRSFYRLLSRIFSVFEGHY
jgi:hypothetical protein